MPVITDLDTMFKTHIAELQTVCRAASDATCGSAQRKWYFPPLGTWSGDPQDILNIREAFDRTTLNSDYENLINNPDDAAIGESMVVKLQTDYVAAEERAFRTRHASSVRCKIHAAARRHGLGTTNGILEGNLQSWLYNMLNAAHDNPY